MTHPTGGSAPLGQDPTAALPTAPPVRPAHPPLVPVAGPAGSAPVPPRDGDGRRRRRPPLAWLPWALLAALLSLLALMVLVGTLVGDDTRASSSRSAASTAARGSFTAGGVDVLADRGRLVDLQGEEAVGRGLSVQSVVADEGFWVGTSAADRTFVYLTPQARRSSGESGFQVRAGQRIDLNGTVTGTSPGDPERFGLTDAEGAKQLTGQRVYVRAVQVRLSS